MITPLRACVAVAWLPIVTAACEPYATTPRARIARELACNEERTKLRPVARAPSDPPAMERLQAHGCGRAASYVCTASMDNCWREGDVRDDPQGPPLGTKPE